MLLADSLLMMILQRAQFNYIFKSPFYNDLSDLMGNMWTTVGYAGIVSNALYLDNPGSIAHDYLRIPIPNFSKIFSTEDFTLRLKVKFNRIDGIRILSSCRNLSQGAGFYFGVFDGKLCFATYDNSTTNAVYLQSSISINTTDFFNFSIERKNQKYYMYFNNNLVDKYETVTGIKAPYTTPIDGAALGVMTDNTDYFLSGYIKDFEVIDIAIGDGGSTTQNF